VERHRRLARAGAALDHDDAAAGLRDQLELLLVDQRGDLGERLVGARDAVVHAELALGAGRGHRARGLAHPAVEHRRDLPDRLHPRAARVLHIGALRRADPAQVAAGDRDVAARLDHPLDAPAGDLLLVVVALLVPVVDPRHRRVAPVDDLDVRLPIDEAALADHHVARLAVLAQPHVREVRRRDVHRQRLAAAEPRLERREPRHLLDQRRQVLGARLGDLIAQRQEVGVEVRRADLRPIIALLAERDPGLHLAVEALFLRDDLSCGAVLGDLVRHRVTGESIRIALRRKM
jgi:hypothetical protein